MSKQPKKRTTSYKLYQLLIAVIAVIMILSMIAAAVR